MTVSPLEDRLRRRTPALMNGHHPCAVLVSLVEVDGEDHLLYEVRASSLRWQPGEVCFPGGGIEGDESPAACALRETEEELGIPRTAVEIIAPLDTFVHAAGFPVYPILGRIDPTALKHIHLNPAEVQEVFTVSLQYLLDTPPETSRMEVHRTALDPLSPRGQALVRSYASAPGTPFLLWEIQGRALWGMTARITQWFLNLLRQEETP